MSEKEKGERDDQRLSFHPLKPEEALRGFMQVDLDRIKGRQAEEQAKDREGGDAEDEAPSDDDATGDTKNGE